MKQKKKPGKSEGRYRALFENMDEGFCAIEMVYDAAGKAVDYRFLEINKAFVRQTGLRQALKKTMREMVPNHDAHWFEIYGKVAQTGKSIRFQNPASAMGRFYDVFAFRIGGNGSQEVGILFKDVTESNRMQEALREKHDDLERRVQERTFELAKANEELRREVKEKAELQAQLIQSQKMEAVGRLAGGIAHDFNNLLTAIAGCCDFLLKALAPGDSNRADVEEIEKAGQRASALTRQLLAFSRQQILEPVLLNINTVVTETGDMFRRLIGEDIHWVTSLDEKLNPVKADQSQITQVIMNLVVNARDAMPKGGTITVETANVELGEDYTAQHLEVSPGPYVMLAVSDTGCGIAPEIRSRIFEPFFTTKEQGKGTGLGLPTVYGIVKQSGGSIFVYSEPGHGTTFKIYLPMVQGSVLTNTKAAPVKSFTGTETILVAEDDEMVRKIIERALNQNGYTVLKGQTVQEIMEIYARHKDSIRLLLTDVVMPQMQGPDLAKILRKQNPRIKVIYMSGYADRAIIENEILATGQIFLQKPLTLETLLRKVREALDGNS